MIIIPKIHHSPTNWRNSHHLPMIIISHHYYGFIFPWFLWYPMIMDDIIPSYSHLIIIPWSTHRLDPAGTRSAHSSAASPGSRRRWRDRTAPPRRPRWPPCAPCGATGGGRKSLKIWEKTWKIYENMGWNHEIISDKYEIRWENLGWNMRYYGMIWDNLREYGIEHGIIWDKTWACPSQMPIHLEGGSTNDADGVTTTHARPSFLGWNAWPFIVDSWPM